MPRTPNNTTAIVAHAPGIWPPYFIEPSPDQLLRVAVGLGFRRGRLQHVYSLLRGKDLETGIVSPERREEQFAILREAQDYVVDLTNWHEFLKCLTRAGFRSSRMISSENALLYTYALCWSAGETSASTCPGCGR